MVSHSASQQRPVRHFAAPRQAVTVALAGNPNSGKTTLFNALTGARQHVGNYPGVTIEKKVGTFDHGGRRVTVVDLPGTYSLTAYSADELVARDFVVNEQPDMVVDVIDSSNLERNLYLAVQFMELGVPVLLCLNMTDEMEARGLQLDLARFRELVGCPAVQTVGTRRKGIGELKDAICALHDDRQSYRGGMRIDYGADLEPHIERIAAMLADQPCLPPHMPPRWLAIKLLEGDEQVEGLLAECDAALAAAVWAEVAKSVAHLHSVTGDRPDALIPEHRYGHLAGVVRESVRATAEARQNLTDRLDNVLTHRFFGLLILLAAMYAVYQFTFLASTYPVQWLEAGFQRLAEWVARVLPAGVSDGQDMLHSLLIDGVIGGVGGVLGFLPWIAFLFIAVAIIEDSGYMARIAFVMDRILRVFGLHGKSVLAMIVSGGLPGGCAAPGVLATRVLRSRRDRIATILVVPLLMCGAKIPVIALICGAFFGRQQGLMMFLYTAITWAMVMVAAVAIKSTVLRGPREPFVMELPPYRMPTVAGILRHTWDRAWMYLKKAGTVLLAVSILLWAMMYFPRLTPDQLAAAGSPGEAARMQLEQSFAGRAGIAIEPITRQFGQNWRTSVALVGGLAAKEVVVSTLGTAYSLGEVDVENSGDLAERLGKEPDWTPLSAFALGFFVLAYSPCVVTVWMIGREAGWRWAAFAVVYTTAAGYVLAVAVFQGGRLLGLGT